MSTQGNPAEISSKRGRRSGGTDTRELIISAARELFAQERFDGVSMRQIARAAGVDPALVHHYFSSKDELFSACVKMPIEPLEVVAKVMVSPPEQRGVTMLNTVIELWDSPVQPALLAVIRSAIASPDKASLLRQFLQKMLLTNALSDISGSIEDKQLRASLLISQLFGLIAARHVLKLEPIASASVDDLVQWVAPTLQRYLTGNIDD